MDVNIFGLELSTALAALGPIGAILAPLLVFLIARQRVKQEAKAGRAADDAGLWERMAAMVDRYGERADELSNDVDKLRERLTATEQKARELQLEVTDLRGTVNRWRAYALALIRQMQAAGITPLDLADYGLGDDD